jgi:DNA-binding transcriptional LysR family regulator
VRSRSGVKLTVNGKQVLQPIRENLKWNEQLKQQVKRDRMLATHSTDHLLIKATYMPQAQIAYEDFIIPKPGSDYDVQRVLEKAGIKLNIKFSAGDDYAIIAMVEKGLGISILPELVTRFQHEHVAMLELEEHSFRSLGIAVNSMKYASPATRRFLQHVQSWSSDQEMI